MEINGIAKTGREILSQEVMSCMSVMTLIDKLTSHFILTNQPLLSYHSNHFFEIFD